MLVVLDFQPLPATHILAALSKISHHPLLHPTRNTRLFSDCIWNWKFETENWNQKFGTLNLELVSET